MDGSRHLRTWYTKRTHLGNTGQTLRTNIPPEKADGTLLINNLFVVNIFCVNNMYIFVDLLILFIHVGPDKNCKYSLGFVLLVD